MSEAAKNVFHNTLDNTDNTESITMAAIQPLLNLIEDFKTQFFVDVDVAEQSFGGITNDLLIEFNTIFQQYNETNEEYKKAIIELRKEFEKKVQEIMKTKINEQTEFTISQIIEDTDRYIDIIKNEAKVIREINNQKQGPVAGQTSMIKNFREARDTTISEVQRAQKNLHKRVQDQIDALLYPQIAPPQLQIVETPIPQQQETTPPKPEENIHSETTPPDLEAMTNNETPTPQDQETTPPKPEENLHSEATPPDLEAMTNSELAALLNVSPNLVSKAAEQVLREVEADEADKRDYTSQGKYTPLMIEEIKAMLQREKNLFQQQVQSEEDFRNTKNRHRREVNHTGVIKVNAPISKTALAKLLPKQSAIKAQDIGRVAAIIAQKDSTLRVRNKKYDARFVKKILAELGFNLADFKISS